MFKSEGWSISTNIAWREQLCSLNKNTLISFNLPESIKIRVWSNGNVLWWDRLWSRSDRHEKKGRWRASVWVQGYDLELLQLVRSRLGNIMCSKRFFLSSADDLNTLNDQSLEFSTSLRTFGIRWRRLYAAVGLSSASSVQDLRKKMNATIDGNNCCDTETMPWRSRAVIKAKGGQMKCVAFLVAVQCKFWNTPK